ncbi:6602_t:CDS:2, partial [Dentiscutata erythropus]
DQEIENPTHNDQEIEDNTYDEDFTYDEDDEQVSCGELIPDNELESDDETAKSTDSAPTNQLDESPIWQHFERKPDYVLDSNVCKYCTPKKKYKLTTSISSLRVVDI